MTCVLIMPMYKIRVNLRLIKREKSRNLLLKSGCYVLDAVILPPTGGMQWKGPVLSGK